MGRYSDMAPTVFNKLWLYGTGLILVAALWAVIFHRQIGRRRFSLASLVVLVLMEAAYFAAIKYFRCW